jgi:hypothetical protein
MNRFAALAKPVALNIGSLWQRHLPGKPMAAENR